MIRNIIFDIGRVLLEFEPLLYLETKYTDPLLAKELYNTVFLSKEWIELDKGTLTDEQAIDILCKRHNEYYKYITDIMKDWTNILTSIDGSVGTLVKLKNTGYKIYLLSNFHDTAFQKIYEKYPFFKLTDGMVISSKINLLKPEKQIYEYLINMYFLDPKECIFIDDTSINIEAAKSLGFNTIQFINPEQMKDELKKYKLF